MASATMAGMAADPGKDVLDSVGPKLFAEALEKQNYKTVQSPSPEATGSCRTFWLSWEG